VILGLGYEGNVIKVMRFYVITIKLLAYYNSIMSCFEISISSIETLNMCPDVLEKI
jgi:hypothetical protein